MNIGLYQSASALSALERWQDSVAQNITSSQTTAFRKRTVNFSVQTGGELHTDPRGRAGRDSVMPVMFPQINGGISFISGETQATRRELDVAIQSDGFFEVQRQDGSRAYTRNGQFQVRSDRTIVTADGAEVMSDGGSPLLLVAGGGSVAINRDGTIFQGANQIGKIAVQRFQNTSALIPTSGGYFIAPAGSQPQASEAPELLQGYLEGSNVTPLREMVDLVLIARAYEANQKIITTVDQQMEKTLEALG
jgi:flagellar basal-body rod protein FlgF